MATDLIISLTASTGETFSIGASDVVYATDDSNSKAVLTYKKEKGVNNTCTLTISTSALQALSTNILFIASVLDSDDNAVDYCFNNKDVTKIIDGGSTCVMQYLTNAGEVPVSYNIDDTAANVASDCGTVIAVTDDQTQDVYYVNGLRVLDVESDTQVSTILESAVVVAAGTGHVVGDTLPLSGGTYTDQAVVEVATTKPVSLATNAEGTSYNVGDTILTAGGTASTHATLTVTHIKASATLPAIVAAGNGYNVGDKFTVTTGTGTQAVYEVATLTGGAGSGVATITLFSAGDYTARPTLGVGVATAHTTGSGDDALTVTLVAADYGVHTAAITTAGSYTVNSSSFTQNTSSGAGTGATFNTVVYGVNTATVSNAGAYSVVPSNPVSQGTSSGSGVGATFTATFGEGNITGSTIYYNDENLSVPAQLEVEESKSDIVTAINAL